MIRTGFGYDVHPLTEGTPLILGGVHVPWPKGLSSYSDGDVLLHAIMDALLGAAGLGDIGTHFPDTDPMYRGHSSLLLLSEVKFKLQQAGFEVNNIDCTVVAQNPKIMPYVSEMREIISRTLGITPDLINVKATTTEHMGFTGREEGIACYAICTLVSNTR